MADLAKFIPTVQIEGEIVTEPQRTFVTRVFYSRVLMKTAPFALAIFWLLYHPSIIGKIVGLALILVLVPIFLPRLSGIGSLGGVDLTRFHGHTDRLLPRESEKGVPCPRNGPNIRPSTSKKRCAASLGKA